MRNAQGKQNSKPFGFEVWQQKCGNLTPSRSKEFLLTHFCSGFENILKEFSFVLCKNTYCQ
jgi:hypothetical protein